MFVKSKCLLFLGAGLVLIGCSAKTATSEIPKHSLLGTWSFEKAPPDIESGIEFKEDNTWRNWFKGKGKSTEQSGKYSLDGDNLTLNRDRAVLPDGKVSTATETNKTMLQWDTDNRFSMIAKDGAPMYLKRK